MRARAARTTNTQGLQTSARRARAQQAQGWQCVRFRAGVCPQRAMRSVEGTLVSSQLACLLGAARGRAPQRMPETNTRSRLATHARGEHNVQEQTRRDAKHMRRRATTQRTDRSRHCCCRRRPHCCRARRARLTCSAGDGAPGRGQECLLVATAISAGQQEVQGGGGGGRRRRGGLRPAARAGLRWRRQPLRPRAGQSGRSCTPVERAEAPAPAISGWQRRGRQRRPARGAAAAAIAAAAAADRGDRGGCGVCLDGGV